MFVVQITRIIIILVALGLSGCARKDTVVLDAVRDGKFIYHNQRVDISELAPMLKAQGFGSDCMFYPHCAPTDLSRFTNDTLFFYFGTKTAHEHIRRIYDALDSVGIGRWPESNGTKM